MNMFKKGNFMQCKSQYEKGTIFMLNVSMDKQVMLLWLT